MKNTVAALLLLTLIAVPVAGRAHPCDAESADGRGADSDRAAMYAAYDFGLKIQDAIRHKDSAALLALMEGELIHNGPRRSVIAAHPFDEIFPVHWQDSVLSGTPQCGRVGWRGYMLSRGLVWYEKSDTAPARYTLTGLNMPFDEDKYLPDRDLPQGWFVDGELVPPQCLPQLFMSGDNFESFSRHYKIDDDLFQQKPGQFFGAPIRDLDIRPDSWAIQVIARLDQCGNEDTESSISPPTLQEDGSILSGEIPNAQGYKIFGRVDPEHCAGLLPHYPVKPEICYAVNVTQYTSGSMRQYDLYYIYGLVRARDKAYILPLLSFDGRNDMINYVETHKEPQPPAPEHDP